MSANNLAETKPRYTQKEYYIFNSRHRPVMRYSKDEDDILYLFANEPENRDLLSYDLWQKAEAIDLLPGRSASSMMNRYRVVKKLYPHS